MSGTSGNVNSRAFDAGAAAEALTMMAPIGALDAELDRREVSAPDADGAAKAALLLAGVRSQGDFAAQVLNVCGGGLDPDDLTRALRSAFPGAAIGRRHGPHYMSNARQKKLRGLRPGMTIPYRSKTKAAEGGQSAEEDVPVAGGGAPSLEDLIAEHKGREGRKRLQGLAKGLGVSAGGKTVDIAKRIVEHGSAAVAA